MRAAEGAGLAITLAVACLLWGWFAHALPRIVRDMWELDDQADEQPPDPWDELRA